MEISAFTYVHNALEGGYPIIEAVRAVRPYVSEIVAVDMASTDGTRDLLQRLNCRILNGEWGNEGGETLNKALLMNSECKYDTILHFEADEVYSDELLKAIMDRLFHGVTDIAVHRIQVEQNFQRCRWYPIPVHRVWYPRGSVRKGGVASTNRHRDTAVIPPDEGLLWDVRACFRDNVRAREEKLSNLYDTFPVYRITPLHFMMPQTLDNEEEVEAWLSEPHWTYKKSPFDLPDVLKPLVGMTRYEARV